MSDFWNVSCVVCVFGMTRTFASSSSKAWHHGELTDFIANSYAQKKNAASAKSSAMEEGRVSKNTKIIQVNEMTRDSFKSALVLILNTKNIKVLINKLIA